jgi:hypothetical protein
MSLLPSLPSLSLLTTISPSITREPKVTAAVVRERGGREREGGEGGEKREEKREREKRREERIERIGPTNIFYLLSFSSSTSLAYLIFSSLGHSKAMLLLSSLLSSALPLSPPSLFPLLSLSYHNKLQYYL